jgi:hypothetical protein
MRTSKFCSSGDQIEKGEMCWTRCTLQNDEQCTQNVSPNPLKEETTHKIEAVIK